MFEILLAEWHLPPDHIISKWSTEMLTLMTDKLVERKKMQSGTARNNTVSDSEFFSQAGIKVIKK
jgi:hypothetical protein